MSFKRAIFFYVEAGELRVMNHAQIGDSERRDGIESVYAFLVRQRGVSISKEDRGHGAARHSACIVADKAALKAAALSAGIEVRGLAAND